MAINVDLDVLLVDEVRDGSVNGPPVALPHPAEAVGTGCGQRV
jgi:hypothetical protein